MKQLYSIGLVTLFLCSASPVFSQSPTICPISAGPNQSICVPNCATLTGTFVPTNQTTTYAMSSIPYTPDPFTAGTAVTVSDDQWSGVIPLPFTFCFFGTAYNSLLIGSNCILTFNTTLASGYCQWPIGAAFPSTSDPMNSIGGPWQDLYPPGGGTIKYATYGTAPCRRFVVSWNQVAMYGCFSTLHTSQLVLYETTNIIDNFIQTKPLCTTWNAGAAIQGIQNAAGNTAFVQPGRNYPTQWTATNDGKRWTPSGANTYTVGWYQGATLIASTASTVVCPTATTVYTFQETSTNCNGVPATVSSTMTVTVTSLVLSGTSTPSTSCSGCNGTASVTVVSGTGPFTYAWSPSGGTGSTATGLCAGTYTCTVTGASSCTGTQTFTITAPPALTATQTQTNILCNGSCTGVATVTASGGTAPYTYSWAPSGGTGATASALCAGTYTCTTTDANGCTFTNTFNITQPPALTATQSQVNILCNGSCTGSATVVASGGTAPYTYSWAPSGGTGATASSRCAGTYTCTITDANGCVITKTFNITQPPVLAATSSSSTATCGSPNGSATVTPSGGTPGYTYSWAPTGGTGATATGLTAGTYTCTITDANGCIITQTVTVTSTNSLSASITATVNVSCNGGNNGSATVTPIGGNPGFTYSWSPAGGTGATGTGLTAGNYTVTVTDAGGCTATATVAITQPPVLTSTGSQVNVTCNGGSNGSATVTPSGGTPAYTYSWAPSGGTGASASGLTAGSYTCTITDANGCVTTGTFTITQATLITATTSTVSATCGNPNGSATVTPSGGTPGYTYSWAPSGGTGATATGLAAGSYTCTITDAAGCMITQTVSITNAGSPSATISASTNVTCNGGNDGLATVTASGGSSPYTYAWAPSGGTGATASGLTAGTYTVTVTDANGCQNSATVTITEPPAITATQSQVNVTCNAACNGSATVVASGGTGTYTYSWAPSGGTGASASGLCAGTYTCTISSPAGCSITQSFTITQPTALTATQSQVNVTCNAACNGSATVVPSGGTPGYTYSWAPTGGTGATASSLCAGTYTCTITDANGCSITQSLTITEPAALTGTTTIVQSTCGNPNGSATVTPSGGVGPYTYSWAPSGGTGATATGLPANIYTVTITDANGCTATATANVTNAGSPTATITSSTNVSCFGGSNGSATVSASGGTGPYTYLWTPSGGTGTTASGLTANNYNVTVTDANGCTATASVAITEPPALTATASSTPVLCNGGNTGSATVTPAGGVPSYTYSWVPSGGTGSSETNLTANSYTCTITDANGCTTTASTTVTQPTALAVTSSQVDELCNGGTNGSATVNISGGTPVYTYSWAPSGGTGATANGLAAGTYTCTATDTNGCTITQSFTITEPTLLTVTTTTVSSTCGNPNGSATAIPAGGTGPYAYAWSPSGGSGATEPNLAAGTYSVIVTDSNGCTANTTATVTNMGSPTVTITSSVNVACNGGNTGSATSSGSGGTGTLTYSWAPSGGNAATENNLAVGIYTVTVTDVNGCQDTAQVTITEPPLLTVSTTQADELCFGGTTASADAIPAGGVPGYTYAWSNADTTATTSGITAGGYSVTVTDANGCTATASVTITEPTQITLTTSQVDETCFGGSSGSATVTPAGGTPGYIYSWSPSGGTNPTENNLSATSYTVNVTDANGCFTSASVTITEPTAVVVTATSVDAHCNQSDGSSTANGLGGTGTITYAWQPSGSGATLNNIPAGTYTVIATDANGCSDTTTTTVNNLNGVNATLTSVTNLTCFQSADGVIVTGATGGVNPYSYTWSAPASSVTGTANGLPAGTYTLVVSDASGCTSTVTATVTEPTQLTVSASASPSAVCLGSSVQLNAIPAGGTPSYTVNWMPGNLSGTSPNIIPAASGNDTVFVVDANGCTANAVVAVTVFPVPTAAFTSDVTSGCAPVCVQFTDASSVAAPGIINAWNWDFGDGNTSTLQSPSHCYTTPGSYTVILSVKTADGCIHTVTMAAYITIYANPVAAFSASPQPTTLLNPDITFTDSSSNAVSWSWSFGDLTGSTSSLQNPTFSYPPVATCYQVLLTVTSADGCTDTITHPVCLDPDVSLYVPNAFTPDGNGLNDVFLPYGEGLDPDHFEMWIFDRWGNMIYYTDDLAKGWNGHVNGGENIAQIDTYVWKIKATDLTGVKHNLVGKVSLVK